MRISHMAMVIAICTTNMRRCRVQDPAIELVGGAVTSGPDLSVEVNGLKLPNPFVIGSGPPGT
jgi:dihydropyrimidine dehydrogenase (NADP+)